LVDRGEETLVVDNLSTGRKPAVPAKATFFNCDIGDAEAIMNLLRRWRVRTVLHFAGSTVVRESMIDPLRYYLNNAVKSHALVEACVKAGVERLVYSSSAAVYGIPKSNPVSEATPLRPISPYGSSKLMTEWILRDADAAYGFPFVALRYFNVAGADFQMR